MDVERETERLVLRRWRPDDLPAFAALNADPEVMRHFVAPLSRAESDGLAAQLDAHLAEHGWGLWAIALRETGRFAGFCGLAVPSFDAPFTPAVETGWRLARWAWGHGYATEAANAALGVAFGRLGLDEVVSFTATANAPSQAVMRRLGMTRDPDGDFDHPMVPEGHPLRRHVLFRVRRELAVRSVAVADTRPLRRAVLRPLHEDDAEIVTHEPAGAHAAGAFRGDRLVGVGLVGPGGGPDAWRVRGMATAADVRGLGAGTGVLRALVDHARDQGARRIWCNARIPARSLYERAGFTVVSEPFELPDIGPHLRMELDLGRTTIGQLLGRARARLERVGPAAAAAAMARGSVLIDVRADHQRERDGLIPGAHVVARNVLEWRLDPASGHSDPALGEGFDRHVIVVCHEGYQSSLAAATLQDLGFARATDLDGGFEAWRAAGLPVVPPQS